MAVKVKIEKANPSIPDDFIFSVLSSTIGLSKEEFEKLKGEKGISIYVKDEEAVNKLKLIAQKHSSLIKIEFEKTAEGGAFSITNKLVRSNVGLALSWSALLVVFTLLSMVPILGFFVNFLSGAFYYGFVLYVAYSLKDGDSFEEKIKELKIGDVFREYLGAGFGMSLGFFVLSLLGIAVLVVFGIIFGSLGAFSDIITYGDLREGFTGSMIALSVLILLVVMWLVYAIPLLFSKSIREKPDFGSAFMEVLKMFTPSFIGESFSGRYVSVGGIWSLIITVGMIAFFLTFVFIITIPVSLLILYWMNLFLAVLSVLYIKKS